MSPRASWEGETHQSDLLPQNPISNGCAKLLFRQLEWTACGQIWKAKDGSGENCLFHLLFGWSVLLFWSPPSSGVLRDMRHQLLPEGDLFFGRIVSIPPFPHFIVQIFPSFYVLLLGRILSGVSTSCLYSVFEVINPTSRKNNIVRIKNKTQYISELVCCGAQGSRIAQRNALIDSCTGRGQIRITYFQNQKVLLF